MQALRFELKKVRGEEKRKEGRMEGGRKKTVTVHYKEVPHEKTF